VALREHFETSGVWLFRWRSYLPLILLVVVLLGLRNYHDLGNNHHTEIIWELGCFGVGLVGLLIRAYAIGYAFEGTSSRITRKQQADALNTSGLYSVVRHPLYVGNYLMWISVALFTRTIWVPVIVTLSYWLFYERVMAAEEAFLRRAYGSHFEEWAARTPAFFPAFRNWRRPVSHFNWKRVLQSEKSSQLGLVTTFALLNLVINSRLPERVSLDAVWLVLFGVSVTYYGALALHRKIERRRINEEPAAISAAGSKKSRVSAARKEPATSDQ